MVRGNNFDFLRLVFASSVIITHSYILSGAPDCDWLCQITKGGSSFSNIGVKGFFVISGYLIYKSLLRSDSIKNYFWKRFLRLVPGLFILLLLTVILAPFVYEGVSPFLKNKSVWTYIPRNLLLFNNQFEIEGVFESNPYKSTINGSLWTIRYEVTMYVFLSFLFVLRKRHKVVKFLLCSIFLLLTVLNILFIDRLEGYGFILGAKDFLDLSVFFIAGSILAVINFEKVKFLNSILLIAFVLFLISFFFHFFDLSKFVVLPVLVIAFGLKSTPFINNIGNKVGDLSYGIYIYGFPVQQTLEYFFKLDYLQLMILGLAISFILAYISWHFIEAKALQLKKIPSLNRSVVVNDKLSPILKERE